MESKLREMESEVRKYIIADRMFPNYISDYIETNDDGLYVWYDDGETTTETRGQTTWINIPPLRVERPDFPYINLALGGEWGTYARPNNIFINLYSISRNVSRLEHEFVLRTLAENLDEVEGLSFEYSELKPIIDDDHPAVILVTPRYISGARNIEGLTPYWNIHRNVLEEMGRNFFGYLGVTSVYWAFHLPPNEVLIYSQRNAHVKSTELRVGFDDYRRPTKLQIQERIRAWLDKPDAGKKIIIS